LTIVLMQPIFSAWRAHRWIARVDIGSLGLLLLARMASAAPINHVEPTPPTQRAESAQTETPRPDTNAEENNSKADDPAPDQESSSLPSPRKHFPVKSSMGRKNSARH
jgi:hypothetical protein